MKRIERLIHQMKLTGLNQLIVADPVALKYLTGDSFQPDERLLVLLIKADGSTSYILNELIPKADWAFPVNWYNDHTKPIELLSHLLDEGTVGIDKNWPAHFVIDLIQTKPELRLAHGSVLIDQLRQRKDEAEQAAMRQASALNDLAMERLIGEIYPGMSEREVVDRLADIYHELGTDGFSFDPIVGFGVNSANPHHQPGDTILGESGPLVIDIGCRKGDFCSDMTRTIYLGQPDETFREVYQVVRAANLNAIALIRPGVTFAEIDAAARQTIEQAGYGAYFTHRTGHGIGREVHEAGDVSAANHSPVEPGMIFSIEPGIYLPGRFGVRIEDLVLVTQDGVEVLNYVSKDLRSLE